MNVACPGCSMVLAIEEVPPAPPPGTILRIVCTRCKHKGPLSHFEKAFQRIEWAKERKIADQTRKREAEEAAVKLGEETRERARIQAEVMEEAKKRQTAIRLEAGRRENEARQKARLAEIAAMRLQCPVCERLCSSEAKACPGCGQPVETNVPMMRAPIPEGEIASLRVIGAIFIVFGCLCLLGIGVGGGAYAVAGCISGLATGFVLRALAGIWMACEVAARR